MADYLALLRSANARFMGCSPACRDLELTCSHLISIEQAIVKAAETLKDNYHPLRHLIAG